MYNSRPRKMNYGGYSAPFTVPENYSGNAFFGGEEEEEKIARDKLKHCKMFAGYTEKDAVIDAIISDPNNSVTNAREMVRVIKEREPSVYREMEENYASANTVVVQPAVSMSR